MKRIYIFALTTLMMHAYAFTGPVRVLCVAHTPFQKLRMVRSWVKEQGHLLTVSRPYAGDVLPGINSFDFLIVLGGSQDVHDLHIHPYLKEEIVLLKKAVESNKCVLGVCLGCQLLGEVFGATTQRSPQKEIGMFPVMLTEAGKNDAVFKDFPATFDAFHWHNFMIGFSDYGVLLAKSAGCPHQVIRYGDSAYGVQFHLEAVKDGVINTLELFYDQYVARSFLKTEHDRLIFDLIMKDVFLMLQKEHPYVQTPQELLQLNFDTMNERFKKMLTSIVEIGKN